MNKKINNLIKFLRSNGLEKYAGDLVDFFESGGNPLQEIADYIQEKSSEEQKISGMYLFGPGLLAGVYIKLIRYLKEHEGRYNHIIENHFSDRTIQKLEVAKFILGVTKDYIASQSQIEGLSGAAKKLDEKMKGEESKKSKLEYVDNIINIFDFLIKLKSEEMTQEQFSEKLSEIDEIFNKDTKVKSDEGSEGEETSSESKEILDYREERKKRRMLGMTGGMRRFDVFDGGKEDPEDEEDRLYRELAEMEIPSDAFPGAGEGDDEANEEHANAHGDNYDPETHLYDPDEYPPGFFDD